jgi:DASS family divalent anion:Na+ symporter
MSSVSPTPELRPEGRRLWRFLPVIGIVVVLWWLSPPGGLSSAAVHLTAIFLATIAGLVIQPLPQGAVVISGLALAAITSTLPVSDVLGGYSDSTVWLIVVAFLLARGFIHTGLGRRIAFITVRAFGRSTLGLGYALTLADAVIAPATPSNTARAGGILFPVVRALASCLGSEPGPTARRAGAFLIFNVFQTNLVTSALFLTGVAPNAMIAKLAGEAFGYQVTWLGWFTAAVVPATVSLALLPLLIYRLLRPELRASHRATELALEELAKMGPMSRAERKMLAVFAATLLLWATGQWTGLNATGVALAGVSTLILMDVIRWQDVLAERGAWDALVWFGGLVSLASGLAKLGVIDLMAASLKAALAGVDSWLLGFVLLVVAYVYSHYFIASMTAHATALYVPLGLVGVSLGVPVPLVVYVLGFMNSLNAAMTTYGTGPSPIYYGAGYLDQAAWWRCGFIVSIANVAIWLLTGSLWWRFLFGVRPG